MSKTTIIMFIGIVLIAIFFIVRKAKDDAEGTVIPKITQLHGKVKLEFKGFHGINNHRMKNYLKEYKLGTAVTFKNKHYIVSEVEQVREAKPKQRAEFKVVVCLQERTN